MVFIVEAVQKGLVVVDNRWDLVVVVVDFAMLLLIPMPLKFGQNWVNNRWDIANIEFPGGGGGIKSYSFQT